MSPSCKEPVAGAAEPSSAKIETLYTVSRVWIAIEPRNPNKKIVGRLSLIKTPADGLILDWIPLAGHVSIEEAQARDYRLHHRLADVYSLRRKGSQVLIMLASEELGGGAGASLPPFNFEAGGGSVRQFLAYMHVNLAATAGSSPHLKVKILALPCLRQNCAPVLSN